MKFNIAKTTCFLCLSLLLASAAVGQGVKSGSTLPPDVAPTLAQRDQHLSNLTFIGDMGVTSNLVADAPEITAGLQRVMERNYQKEYPQMKGATSKAAYDQMVKRNVASIAEDSKGWSTSSSHQWMVTRSGVQTLAHGVYQDAPGVIGTYSQYYDADKVLMIGTSAETPKHQPIEPGEPVVFSVPGEATRYRYPNSGYGLGLMPEDFVMLAGANPLAMYGAAWHLVEQTPNIWVITTHIDQGESAPFDVTLTLDRARGGIPTIITNRGKSWTTRYEAVSYKWENGEWVCSKYRRLDNSIHHFRERDWSLVSVGPSTPIHVSFRRSVAVADYRLLGQHITAGDVWKAEGQSSRVVYYPWKGTFPSIKDLQSLYTQKHPGEATPDPKRSSSLPFVGGLLCLVGGVWMFKRRGVS